MRLSELLGAKVIDERGRAVGKVHDIRLEQTPPERAGATPDLRVHGLIVGRRALGARLGFGRGGLHGPWLLKVVFGTLGHDAHYVPWHRIRSIRPGQIHITGAADHLGRLQPFDQTGDRSLDRRTSPRADR